MFKARRRGSAITTTIFILFGITAMALIAIEMIGSGIARRRIEGASGKAIYAAEAGLELALADFNKPSSTLFDNCQNKTDNYLDFAGGCSATKVVKNIENNNSLPSYQVKVTNPANTRDIELWSRGSYQGVSREIYVKFCLPSCKSRPTGSGDGCGGLCP